MKYLKIIPLIFFVVLFAACEDDTTSPSDNNDPKPGRYFPLQSGAEWEYETVQQGNTAKLIVANIGETQIDNQTWIEQKSTAGSQSGISHYRYEDGKYYQFLAKGTGVVITDVNVLMIDENAEVGSKWEIPHKVKFQASTSPYDATYTMEFKEELESYDVKGKTYNDVISISTNLSYVINGSPVSRIDQIAYFAADVGLIKVTGFQAGISYSQTLVEYTP